MNLPSVQTAVPGTFATNLFPTLARSQGLIFRFYNICGGMMFSVTKEGLKKVTLKSNNGELITGKAKVGFNASSGLPEVKEIIDGSDEIVLEAPNGESFEVGKFYYMVMFPTTFSGGFTVKLETFTEEATVEKTNKLTAKRSVFGKISNIDGNATYSSKPLKKYLTFTSEGSTDISIQSEYDGFYYSYDKQTWTNWSGESITFSSTSPLYLCGDNPYDTEKGSLGQFQAEGDLFGISGDIMSLVNSDEDVLEVHKSQFNSLFASCTRLTSAPELPATTLAESCYRAMFYGCTNLTSAPELPATTATENCYASMFASCTNLVSVPKLPATTLAESCYASMFKGCTSLTSAPELPATILAEWCYYSMFEGCTSLTSAPELPATSLASSCYWGMFNGCSSLIEAPELPATTLAPTCYDRMFMGCSSLLSAPELPAMIMESGCYWGMFDGCVNLTTAPELPSTNLASECYGSMFNGCKSLTSAPELPATNLYSQCYNFMFMDCTSLTAAPELHATKLAYHCYAYMFKGCTNLLEAPELPAQILFPACYYEMFYGCTSLTEAPVIHASSMADVCCMNMFYGCTNLTTVPLLPATNLARQCYFNMFYGCSKLNYIKCMAEDISPEICVTDWLFGVASSGTFVKSAAISSWSTGSSGIPSGWTVLDGEKTDEGEVFNNFKRYLTFSSEGETTLSFSPYRNSTQSHALLFYSYDAQDWHTWDFSTLTFSNDKPIYICGINPEGINGSFLYYRFCASGDKFSVSGDIMSLIDNCDSLLQIPRDYCFSNLFNGCDLLTSAPELPATVLTDGCYLAMFYDCTSLTTAPELPSTTLARNCYAYMFNGCTELNYLKCLADDITEYCGDWLSGVAASGTFIKSPSMWDWPTGSSGIPEGWTVIDDNSI